MFCLNISSSVIRPLIMSDVRQVHHSDNNWDPDRTTTVIIETRTLCKIITFNQVSSKLGDKNVVTLCITCLCSDLEWTMFAKLHSDAFPLTHSRSPNRSFRDSYRQLRSHSLGVLALFCGAISMGSRSPRDKYASNKVNYLITIHRQRMYVRCQK